MRQKKILCSLVIVIVITILAAGTMAYFTATESIRNKFMVAGYDPDNPQEPEDELFSIKVYETDENGNVTLKGREYGEMLPGREVEKDPTVENTGRYGQWVRAEVILSNAKGWKEIEEKHDIDFRELMGGYDSDKWLFAEKRYDKQADERIYTFYLKRELKSGEKETLFERFRMPAELDTEDLTKLREFEIRIEAAAIQSEGTGENAKAAFENCYGN